MEAEDEGDRKSSRFVGAIASQNGLADGSKIVVMLTKRAYFLGIKK